ncbi:MAG TPA: T9SS type A sorting domain-containing protein [Flavisolibacter sp.]|nr:T9SS type A sorting domain-containing protein [Flavisolibacter sp.]
MKRFVLNTLSFKNCVVAAIACILTLNSFAQTVTIVPTGTAAKPNLIPVNNTVSFSINPIGFGACMYNLTYSWTIKDSKNIIILTSTSDAPKYNFTKEDVYTVTVTVKTVPGGYCSSNITRSASSTIKVAKEGPAGAPKPNMFSANALGTMISAYTMDGIGNILSGPYDYFDPFPADNAITAALSMDDKGNFFYLPTFINGNTPVKKYGVVEVWAVDKNGNNPPVVVASFDMNGASTAELGLYRMGLDQKGNAWILAGDGSNMYLTTFKTNGTKPIKLTDITSFPVPFENGSATDFESGDLAFDNKGNMYVLAGSSTGVNIYTMPTNSPNPKLSKKWKVTDGVGKNFGLAVTGTVFDAKGNMYFSALDGIYFIDYGAVNPATGNAIVKKVSENFGLMDLATSQFPAAWAPPAGTPLPVKLTQFNGVAVTEKVKLNWTVSSNETGSHFELEKSYNGAAFKTHALVLNTDKQGEQAYSFTDAAPITGKVYYRLKMVNKNESATYSNIVFFEAQTKQPSTLILLQNPVHNGLNFNYTAVENATADVTVYTYGGIKILSQKHNLQKGSNSISVQLSDMLTKGMYLLEVKEGSSRQVVRFVKQ